MGGSGLWLNSIPNLTDKPELLVERDSFSLSDQRSNNRGRIGLKFSVSIVPGLSALPNNVKINKV